jgi:hypothetical protein
MMKFGFPAGMAALVVVASVVSNAAAQPPTPALQYVFNPAADSLNKAGGITDVSGNGHNGTVIDSSFAEFATGPSGNNNAIHIDYDGGAFSDDTDGSGINTNALTNDPTLGIWTGPYTVMAWVNLDDQNGDHMVFGSDNPNAPGATNADSGSLYLGFRKVQIYNGWAGTASAVAGQGRDNAYDSQGNRGYVGHIGEWHHVAWRFTGSSTPGYQDMFQDGLRYQRFLTTTYYGGTLFGDSNVPNAPAHLLVGRTVTNSGGFSGYLSDVRIYNVALDDATIASIASTPP